MKHDTFNGPCACGAWHSWILEDMEKLERESHDWPTWKKQELRERLDTIHAKELAAFRQEIGEDRYREIADEVLPKGSKP